MISASLWRKVVCLFALSLSCARSNADTLELAWQIVPGGTAERPADWLSAGNFERGIAFNPVTKHVLVVSRNGGLSIRILDSATGNDITVEGDPGTPKLLSVDGIAGGTFTASMIGVTDDGVIYAANLTVDSDNPAGTAPFKVYRWENEDAAPTVAYEGDPGNNDPNADRWGDSFDVRGAGVNTQLIAGTSDASTKVAIFTTTDGLTFTATAVTGAANGAGAISIAFGSGNTAWSKRPGSSTPLRQFSFDLGAGTATFLRSFDITTVASIGFSGKYFGGIGWETTPVVDNVRVYDMTDLSNPPILVGRLDFSVDNLNPNAVGAVDFGDGMVFFLDTNNGIIAARIVESITPVSISTHPANLTVIETGKITISVSAAGTPPLTYQWMHAGTNLPGATSATLLLSNVTFDHAGDYQVIVDNAGDPVTSNPGVLTVQPIERGNELILQWEKKTGDLPFLTADGTARGIAHNPATGHVLVVSRGNGLAVHVLDPQTGNPVMNGDQPLKLNIDPSVVTGASPAEFLLNMIGTAGDGAIYAANLTTGSGTSAFKVYRWENELPDTLPVLVYSGDPSGGMTDPTPDKRFGDSFDVRGSGENTEILVGSRNGNVAALIKPNVDFNLASAFVIYAADAPNGAFGLTVAFGEGNSFYGTAPGAPVRLITWDSPAEGETMVAGAVAKLYASSEIPFAVANLAYDPASNFLAGNALENPDNVRLYKIADDGAAALLDQELYTVDGANPNGTGSLDFGGGMLFAIDTNNGILAFRFNPTTQAGEPTLSGLARAANGTVTLTISGTVGASYTVQSADNLNSPINWQTVQTVTIPGSGSIEVTDAVAAGQATRFYRAVSAAAP